MLRAGLHDDVVTHSRAEGRPWRPVTPGAEGAPFTVDDTDQRNARFSVVEPDSGALAGSAVLCHYGFVVRGLHRLRIETLADNTAMLRAAERNGFVREGVPRSSAWVMGEFLDEVLLGLLARDRTPDARRRPRPSLRPHTSRKGFPVTPDAPPGTAKRRCSKGSGGQVSVKRRQTGLV